MTHGFIPSVTLNDGIQLPALGFGTYKLNGSSGLQGMAAAIACGYRLLDSAFNYENEGALGAAIRKAGDPQGGRSARRTAQWIDGNRGK